MYLVQECIEARYCICLRRNLHYWCARPCLKLPRDGANVFYYIDYYMYIGLFEISVNAQLNCWRHCSNFASLIADVLKGFRGFLVKELSYNANNKRVMNLRGLDAINNLLEKITDYLPEGSCGHCAFSNMCNIMANIMVDIHGIQQSHHYGLVHLYMCLLVHTSVYIFMYNS